MNVLDVIMSDRSWFKQDEQTQKTEIARRKVHENTRMLKEANFPVIFLEFSEL